MPFANFSPRGGETILASIKSFMDVWNNDTELLGFSSNLLDGVDDSPSTLELIELNSF